MSKNDKMTKNTVPEGFSLGLAIYDAVPVLFFGAAVIFLGAATGSKLFILGGILSAWAGVTKVLWKIIVVIKKQNIWWMFMQMRICMPIGFLLMAAGGILCRNNSNVKEAMSFATEYPVAWFFIAGFVGLVLMGVAAFVLNSADVKANWIEQTINTIAQLCILHGAILIAISVGYYKADDVANNALISDENVYVTVSDGEIVFAPTSEKTATGLIFYPGGKVEYTSYAPLMKEISKQGITCILVEMPLNYAVMDAERADEVIEKHSEINDWYIAGHSLGGAFGGVYASRNADRLSGLILLGAYTTKSVADLPVLSVYGSEDGVMQRQKYEKCKSNLPTDYMELVIPGGNHAMFGSYGEQAGDGKAGITPEEQWRITAEAINEYIYLY